MLSANTLLQVYEVLLSGREMVRWPYGAPGALGAGEDRE